MTTTRGLSKVAAVVLLGAFAQAGAMAQVAGSPYKVVQARLHELQDALDREAKEGWAPRFINVSRECDLKSLAKPGQYEKGECFAVVLERRKP